MGLILTHKINHSMIIGLLVLIFGCNLVYAKQEEKNHSSDELAKILEKYVTDIGKIAKKHPVRMGIAEFCGDKDAEGTVNEFGSYFSEKLLDAFAGKSENIKIFERNRLDAISKEHALTLSGLIDEESARKIGELVPIDYLLTGTYARLKNKVNIIGRLVNVTSGEIIASRSDQILIFSEIESMFPSETRSDYAGDEQPIETKRENCTRNWNSLFEKINAVDPQKRNDALVKECTKIPFDKECGEKHLTIINKFVSEHRNYDLYTDFLIKAMRSFERPEDDSRARYIMRYFSADSTISEKEWLTALDILPRVYFVDFYISNMFVIRDTLSHTDLLRLKQLAQQCKRGMVGIGHLSFDNVLMCFIKSYIKKPTYSGTGAEQDSAQNEKEFRSVIYLINEFKPHLDFSESDEYAGLLYDFWCSNASSGLKDSLLIETCNMINKISFDKGRDKSAIRKICSDLVWDAFKNDKIKPAEKKVYFAAMDTIASRCKGPILAEVTPLQRGYLINSGFMAFCLYTGLDARNVPSADSIANWLSGDSDRKSDAGEYLVYMGKRAATLESSIIRTLRRLVRNASSENDYFGGKLIISLGAIKSKNPEAHALLITCLDSLNWAFPSDEVEAALASIGKPVMPLVHKYCERDLDSHIYSTLDIINLMGPDAANEIPFLESILKKASNKKTQYMIEDAIEMAKKNSMKKN